MVCKKEAMSVDIILVVAPHPDDETLGCGGTLLRHIADGDQVHWLIMSTISQDSGYTKERVESRAKEITIVADVYQFSSFKQEKFITTQLDTYPKSKLIDVVSEIVQRLEPDTIYLPYRGDVHSDHSVVFDAVVPCTKPFRYPSVKRVRAYETLSETEFSINPDYGGFKPNLWVDISQYLDKKIKIMKIYKGELDEHPFPRSEVNLRALASLRGATAGVEMAEGFVSLREIV
jgi:N-acetylglucosamine malate deacetylase 1